MAFGRSKWLAANAGPPPQDSRPQQACARRIGARLGEKASFDFQDVPVAAVAAHFEQQTGENFILDPSARKDGSLDPATRVTGSASDEPLGAALARLLLPAKLTLSIRDELVVFTPAVEDDDRVPVPDDQAREHGGG